MLGMNLNRNIRRLVWHRRDLRLHDNELYTTPASGTADETKIISLYVIDPAEITVKEKDTVPATGPHACRALIGALLDLRRRLEELGGTLLIRWGDPLEIVPSMAAELDVDQVWWSEDPGYYETCLSQNLSNKLRRQGLSNGPSVRTVSGYALYHPDDLPRGDAQWSALARPNEKEKKKKKSRKKATVESDASLPAAACDELCSLVDLSQKRLVAMPPIMGDFRRAASTITKPRPCIEVPCPLVIAKPCDGVDAGELPTMAELTQQMKDKNILGLPTEVINSVIAEATTKGHTAFVGGETEALERLATFLDDGHAAIAVRNLADVSSNNESANISMYLALGSLSPRLVFHRAAAAGDCDWLVSHMTMRDFFVYSAYKQGKDLFRLIGSPVHKAKQPLVWKRPSDHMDLCIRWATGETGLPLIDAGMKEMMSTGYCSNRVRQNMASVLTKDLELDWRYGAAWMQFCLSDHCIGANWGNWKYFGGVGADPKNRHFRTVSQALRYDPNGDYVRKWIPALENETDLEAFLRPWDFVENWQQPIVDPKTQYTWQDGQRLETFGALLGSPPEGDGST
jgi:deoxyribodipyrimidine photo-lyase